MERLIGVTGRAGAGKDSVWSTLNYEIDEPVHRLAFADPLKESAMAALGLFSEQAQEFKEIGQLVFLFGNREVGTISGREYLQLYGTEAHREIFGDDFWVRQAMRKVRGITVITDVRYDNEAEAIIARGGEVWEVRRPGSLIAESNHPTEIPISRHLVNRVLHNDGDLNDLRYEVMRAWAGEEASDERLLKVAKEKVEDELRHNFLKRKHMTERAKLVAAELSEDPDTAVVPGNVGIYGKGHRLPW